MHIIQAHAIGFNKIIISSNDPSNFSIGNISIKNGTNPLSINSYTTTIENSFLIFLDREISIKFYCFIIYEGLQIKVSYKNLFTTEEFNNKFYYNGSLGLSYTKESSTFKVWSPAATSILVMLYKNGDPSTYEIPLELIMNEEDNGVWTITINEDLDNYFYTYKVTVYDSINEVVDPYAKAVGINGLRGAIVDINILNPDGWEEDISPALNHYTDAIIYETSIRDISMHPSSGVIHSGKYLGLTEEATLYNKSITTALSHIKELGITHLQIMPFYDFSYKSIDEKNSTEYNWGYDPQNYNVPEGSFSLNPYDPKCRILELKKMINTLHYNNISVNMDVVYNHVFHKNDNNFEKLFPGYYFRLKNDGSFANGSGCGNDTASEHKMMRKFIVDSVCYWAKEYHIDGFRFDLMGIHDICTMNSIYKSLSRINRKIMIYGEGWNLDTPLPHNIKAIQSNSFKMPNIGFFNDTIRDSIRGNVFSLSDKGFVSGKESLEDTMKFCVMACTISSNRFKAIYASPEQSINYVSCHDNNTLWDKLEISNLKDSIEDKKYMQKFANGIILTSQGVPFLHSGVEFCRTKEGIENSFSSPDSINSINYSRKADFIDIFNYYKGLIKIRKEHPAFRMYSAEHIKEHIEFLKELPKNTVAFILKNNANGDLWTNILIIYNANKFSTTINVPYNRWNLVANKYSAGTDIISIFESNKITVDSLCLNIFYCN